MKFPFEIVEHYVSHLRKILLFSPTDPLFPKPLMKNIEGKGLKVVGLSKEYWKGTQPIRNIFKDAFEAAGIAYYNPHSFRDTLAQYTLANSNSFEQVIAMSKNFGHSNVTTMLNSYGGLDHGKQNMLIKELKPKG